jgi:hypothetical protein
MPLPTAPTVSGWKDWEVRTKLRPLADTERDMVAAAIVEHIRLCNWRVERGPLRLTARTMSIMECFRPSPNLQEMHISSQVD